MKYGTLSEIDGRWRLSYERTLRHPPEKVWSALTEPEHMAAWFPCRVDGPREAGATLRFVFAEEGAPEMEGKMLVYDPPRRLEFSWGDDVLVFDLRSAPDGCVLTFSATFDEVGKSARDGAGWHGCLDLLEASLEGADLEALRRRWAELEPEYMARFGPEASTIGPPDWHPESDA